MIPRERLQHRCCELFGHDPIEEGKRYEFEMTGTLIRWICRRCHKYLGLLHEGERP